MEVELKDEIIDITSKDRDHAYELFERERKEKPQLEMKNRIKLILITGSSGVVGVAVGFIIGFFAAK
jgi:hypothetical protein